MNFSDISFSFKEALCFFHYLRYKDYWTDVVFSLTLAFRKFNDILNPLSHVELH